MIQDESLEQQALLPHQLNTLVPLYALTIILLPYYLNTPKTLIIPKILA